MGEAPVAVGLVGAGPWAAMIHAPVLAAGPETRLAGVWSRTAGHARSLASEHRVPAFESFDALLDACEAVAFAVVPEAQPALAIRAARAGKPLLLEKPLGMDVAGAQQIVDAVDEAGVTSMVVLTYRFAASVREFLAAAASFDAHGGRGCFLSGAFLDGPFAGSAWRQERGGVLDVGPHILDLVDAALGPVVALRAHGDVQGWVGIQCDHAGGAASDVSICCRTGIESRTEVELYGPSGALACDGRAAARADTVATLRAEFAAMVRTGAPHPVDAHRALHLQHLVAEAESQLADR